MAILAIKGHATRGKEVIEILKMLGGVNKYEISDANLDLLYTIRSHDNFIISVYPTNTFIVFTLEEFLKKFPYKVGDRVKVPYEDGRITGNELYEYKILKIKWDDLESTIKYGLPTGDEQRIEYYSTDNLNIWNKKETMEDIIKIDIPKGYEFAGVDDDNQQVVFTKIQPEYPKTYEECCEILNYIPNSYDADEILVYGYMCDELRILQKLLVCRDAYWKIAGKQMGLGKPWEPDYKDGCIKYIITVAENKIYTDVSYIFNYILAFPTEEMRDSFLESEEFAQLIGGCKEFI